MVPIPLPQIRFFHLPSSHSFKKLSQNANFKKLPQKNIINLGITNIMDIFLFTKISLLAHQLNPSIIKTDNFKVKG